MSLNLTIGSPVVTSAAAQGGANLDPFRSFWVGYTFTVNTASKAVQIDNKGYMAVYLSHDSSQKPPARAQLVAAYGPVKEPVVISDTTGSKLTLKNLDYVAAEDCECANQAMQLHLFKFDATRDGGIAAWVDDNGWKSPALPADAQTNNNKPFWKRSVKYGSTPRYAHFLARHRNAGGLQTIAASLPFGSQSLFGHWLKQHSKKIPELTFAATEPDGKAKHWEEKIGEKSIVAGRLPRGAAMVTMGVFGSLLPSDLMRDAWRDLMDGNHDFDLCRALARAASDGSKAHTLRQLGMHSEDCVVVSQGDSPQEFFFLRLTS